MPPKSYRHNAVPNRFSSHFSVFRTNGPRSLSRVKVGTLGFANRIAHSGSHAETGAFPPPATARLCASSEIFYSATLLYTYISRFSVNPHYQQQLHLRPFFIAFFTFSHKRPTFDFTGEIEYTLGFRRKIARSGSHAETCVPLMWRFWGAHAILMVTGKRSKIFLFFLKIV